MMETMQHTLNSKGLIGLFTQRDKRPYAVLGIAVAVMALLALIGEGTGDEGDSVYHYLFARYAFEHPTNFFNHWAKPLFVMVAAPFAQLGITGVKLLNVAFWGVQVYCVIKIAEHFGIRRLWLLPIFAIMAPMNVTHTLSGLTEPMFAAWFAVSILLLLRRQYLAAYILFSFLPFVRSEGLIILCPLLLYALWRRHYQYILLFPLGHVVMAVAGKPVHDDYWWIFNKMTYRGLVSAYGSGPWDHFINNLPSVIGIALCLLLVVGLLYGFFKLVAGGNWFRDELARDEAWLVYGMFLSYFAAHTIFWWKGMFNSFGLMRVLLGIMPAILLICLRGLNTIAAGFMMLHRRSEPVLLATLLAGLAWSFFGRLSWDADFSLNAAQRSLYQASEAVLQKFPNKSENVYYIEAYAAAIPLGLDVFDRYHTREAWRLYSGEPVPPNSIVVYDYWFFGHEARVPLEQLQQDKRLVPMGVFEGRTKAQQGNMTHLFYVHPDSVRSDWHFLYTWDTLSELPKVVDIAGRRAAKIDKQQQYSFAFTSGLKSFPDEASLVVTFDAYCETEGSKIPGMFVFSIEAEYRPYDWRGRPLKNDGLPAKTWQKYRFVEKLPKGKDEKDKIGTCIWNDSEEPVYINNFKVEVLPN
jgi:hypothetical protein